VDRDAAGQLKWQKGRSCDMSQCVEIATAGKEVLVRSSMSPHVLLALSRGEWRDFLADAKEGLFDQVLRRYRPSTAAANWGLTWRDTGDSCDVGAAA
jgi:hypothetical protein